MSIVLVFLLVPMIEVVALALGSLRWGVAALGVLCVLVGTLVIALPFATPETVRWLGVRRAIQLARGAGLVAVALGLAVVALGLTRVP